MSKPGPQVCFAELPLAADWGGVGGGGPEKLCGVSSHLGRGKDLAVLCLLALGSHGRF